MLKLSVPGEIQVRNTRGRVENAPPGPGRTGAGAWLCEGGRPPETGWLGGWLGTPV